MTDDLSRDIPRALQLVCSVLMERGCSHIFAKVLAARQDNEKNGVLLGSSPELMELMSGSALSGSNGSSTKNGGLTVIKSKSVSWAWISEGIVGRAPNAKLIFYPQYPELRLSGFMSSCTAAPDALRKVTQASHGDRVLIFGITPTETIASVISGAEGTEVSNFVHSLSGWGPSPSLKLMHLGSAMPLGSLSSLSAELKTIAGRPHETKRLLPDGSRVSFTGSQSAGYTLESLLGIASNSASAPDKFGYEIKSYTGSRITLMTPEPDLGMRGESGLRAFLEEYGKPGKGRRGVRKFNGTHVCGERQSQTALTLTISNWNFTSNEPTGNGECDVLLVDRSGSTAAGWSSAKLTAHWTRKHSASAFVYTEKDNELVTFGPEVFIGAGTSQLHLLQAIGAGRVVYDPGDLLDGVVKARSQWRVRAIDGADIQKQLSLLFDNHATLLL